MRLSCPLASFAAEDPGGWSHVLARAALFDRAGVDRVLGFDHVVFGEALDEYARPEIGGQAGGRQPTGPDGHWLEPMTTLAVVAGATSRIRLCTNVILAALRRPVVLAKVAATIDVLSKGRLDLGVGVGWQREEYEAAGLSFEGRGRLLNQTIEVCQTLWRNESAHYESEELSFSHIHQMPKPTQAGGVPIWVSGTVNGRSMDRLARYGSGWIPWGDDAADVAGGIARMRAAVAERDRDPGDIGVVGTLVPVRDSDKNLDLAQTMASVPAYREAGVTDFRINLAAPSGQAALTDYLGDVVAAFRSASA